MKQLDPEIQVVSEESAFKAARQQEAKKYAGYLIDMLQNLSVSHENKTGEASADVTRIG